MKKRIKKKIIIFLIIITIFIVFLYFGGKYDDYQLDKFFRKEQLIVIGMSESEVIKILGKPQDEVWIKTKSLHHFSKDTKLKYKEILKLVFCPKTLLMRSCSIGIDVYLNKKGGKVIAKSLFLM